MQFILQFLNSFSIIIIFNSIYCISLTSLPMIIVCASLPIYQAFCVLVHSTNAFRAYSLVVRAGNKFILLFRLLFITPFVILI